MPRDLAGINRQEDRYASYVGNADRCPKCDAEWRYVVDGQRFSKVVGIVVHDQVSEWRCPECGASWDRNATVEKS